MLVCGKTLHTARPAPRALQLRSLTCHSFLCSCKHSPSPCGVRPPRVVRRRRRVVNSPGGACLPCASERGDASRAAERAVTADGRRAPLDSFIGAADDYRTTSPPVKWQIKSPAAARPAWPGQKAKQPAGRGCPVAGPLPIDTLDTLHDKIGRLNGNYVGSVILRAGPIGRI